MKKIKGVNLGNWLVLEKWMQESFFEGTGVEDEVWLNRTMGTDHPKEYQEKMKAHRDTYVTEEDFQLIAQHGLNLVRIPVPFFIFGDCGNYPGCIAYLDQAFDWAEKSGLQILIDLHTVPGSQNGYDNGGLTGVCKWHKNPQDVAYAISVLERLAERYKNRPGLYGIEVLNEPISFLVYITAPSTGRARDRQEAKGSSYVPMTFLKSFYKEVYRRLRDILPEEKVIVFHDGFRLSAWKNFFIKENMKNVMLDTHIYILAMEGFVPIHKPWVYKTYIQMERKKIEKAEKYTPVLVGEWCISNRYAQMMPAKILSEKETLHEQKERYQKIANMECKAWEDASHGWIYWNYQMIRDLEVDMDENWKEAWALNRCWKYGWMS